MRLLLAEDDRVVRITLTDALEESGWNVDAYADGAEALRAATDAPFDLVLTDVRLPGLDGIALFRRLRQHRPDAAVVLMTGYADLDDAVTVMREGARDYITKPFEMDEILLRLGRIRQELEFRAQMEAGGNGADEGSREPLLGNSPLMRQLAERLAAAAATDVSVLVTGETGTGKDLCVRAIHRQSRRAERPFVTINCAAIPENLIESEFFGHEKGAFTGADRRRVGRFEAADGGTLFLDEIGDLPLGHQVKLLRAIETRTFEPVGSSATRRVDVRVICATNRDLLQAIEEGRFRKDLYFRINVIDIQTPPLREHRTDLPLLVGEFLSESATRLGRPVPVLDPCAIAALLTYDFPGNVRELIHALERAVATAKNGVIRLDDLPPSLAIGEGCTCNAPVDDAARIEPLDHAIDHFERQYIQRVLAAAGGHRGRTAAILGISRKSLWQKLREAPP